MKKILQRIIREELDRYLRRSAGIGSGINGHAGCGKTPIVSPTLGDEEEVSPVEYTDSSLEPGTLDNKLLNREPPNLNGKRRP